MSTDFDLKTQFHELQIELQSTRRRIHDLYTQSCIFSRLVLPSQVVLLKQEITDLKTQIKELESFSDLIMCRFREMGQLALDLKRSPACSCANDSVTVKQLVRENGALREEMSKIMGVMRVGSRRRECVGVTFNWSWRIWRWESCWSNIHVLDFESRLVSPLCRRRSKSTSGSSFPMHIDLYNQGRSARISKTSYCAVSNQTRRTWEYTKQTRIGWISSVMTWTNRKRKSRGLQTFVGTGVNDSSTPSQVLHLAPEDAWISIRMYIHAYLILFLVLLWEYMIIL